MSKFVPEPVPIDLDDVLKTYLDRQFQAIAISSSEESSLNSNSGGSSPNGNVASCYYYPGFEDYVNGVEGLVYGHNIESIEAAGIPELPQTIVNFTNALPNMQENRSHFAFNFSPVDGSGSPVTLKVSSAGSKTVGFIAWKWLENDWVPIPSKELAFTLIVVDMDAGQ